MEMATEKAGSLGREGSSKNNPKNVFHRFKTVMLSVDGTPDVPVAPNLIDLHAVTP